MSRRVLVLAVASALTWCLAVPFAAAAPAQAPAPMSPSGFADRLADGRTAAAVEIRDGQLQRSGGQARPDELYRDRERLREPAGVRGILRELVAAAWDVEIGPASDEDGAADDEWALPGERAFARGGADLTGDGLADVLIETWEPATGRTGLRAVRGADGAALWTAGAVADDAFSWPAGDLSGDGADDVFLASFRWERLPEESEACDGSRCRYEWSGTYTSRFELLDGGSGRSLWSRSWPGSMRFAEEWEEDGGLLGGSARFEWLYEDINGVTFPMPADDHSGSGLPDIVLNVLSVRVGGGGTYQADLPLGLAGSEEWTYRMRADTTAELLDGRTGQTWLVRESADAPVVGVLVPTGDLDGDGTRDLVWNRTMVSDGGGSCSWVLVLETCGGEEPAFALEVETIDGRSLEPLWESAWHDLYDWWLHAGLGDLDGDGTADLGVVLASAWDEGELLALHGRDGTTMWSTPVADSWAYPVPIGTADGAGGSDLAVLSFLWVDDGLLGGAATTLEIDRLDGATGQRIVRTRRQVPASASATFAYLFVGEDVDGDTVSDAGGGWLTFGAGWEVSDAAGWVESGATGEERYAFTGSEDRMVMPYGDLDGDGAAEVADIRWEQVEDGWSETLSAVRVLPGREATLWTQTAPSAPWTAGDQDGMPGQELLVTRNEVVDDRWAWEVASLDGRDLAVRWRAP
jgi:hypothetical protein